MREVGAFEAKNQLSELLRRVQGGEEFVITKHGRPLARLTSPRAAKDSDVQSAFRTLQTLRESAFLDRKKGESISRAAHSEHRH